MKRKPSDISISDLTAAGASAGKLAYEAALIKNSTYPNIEIEYAPLGSDMTSVEIRPRSKIKIGIAS